MAATLLYPVRMLGGIALATLLTACGGGNSDGAQGGSLANPEPPTSGDWQLVWEDSFDGDTLDASSWEIQTGNGAAEGVPGWGNNELQYYQADNISVADGVLTIEARADNSNPGFDYTSGRLRTQGKVDFTFGRVEARIKVPSGQGLWSAFWLLGSDPSVYGGWAAKGEIDILEKYLPGFFSSAIHYGGEFPQNEFVTGTFDAFDVADEFHTYAVEWDSRYIRFFVDGENFYTVNSDTYYNYYYKNSSEGFVEGGASAPFDSDHHIILNLAVGGNLPGDPDGTSVFPAQMQVDYVRLYQCPVDTLGPGEGCKNSIDQANEYINFEVAADSPAITSTLIYDDGVSVLFADKESPIELQRFVYDNGGAFSATEVADDNGDAVIEIITSGGGNVSWGGANGEKFKFVNMGNVAAPSSTADVKFEIKVDSSSTDMTGDLLVKFDSGFPDIAFSSVSFNDLAADEWVQVSVRVSDILKDGNGFEFGGFPVNVDAIQNLVVFEPTKAAKFMISNVRIDCGGKQFCGVIEAPAVDAPASFEFGADFESNDIEADTVGGGWLAYVAVFNPGGDRLYEYGAPFPAPNRTNNITALKTGEAGVFQGEQYLEVFSDYANADHGNSNVIDVSIFREYVIQEGDSGVYRFKFDTKRPSGQGALEAPSEASAFIKILDPVSFDTLYVDSVDTSGASQVEWTSEFIEFTIDGAAQAGQIIQFGFNSRATDYNSSAVYYDNVAVEKYSPASFEFGADFESNDIEADTVGGGWLAYVAVFNPGGDRLYEYGAPFPAPNRTNNITALKTGEAGASQGEQYLEVFSDYANEDHGNLNVIDVSIFKEYVIQEDDLGVYRFKFDTKRPSGQGALEAPSEASAFIKILDPVSFDTLYVDSVDTSGASQVEWTSEFIEFTIDGAAQAGQIIQFGFNSRATNYNSSAVYYDNVVVEGIQ